MEINQNLGPNWPIGKEPWLDFSLLFLFISFLFLFFFLFFTTSSWVALYIDKGGHVSDMIRAEPGKQHLKEILYTQV